MYIVIVGAGNVGYHLAKAVLSKGHEVLLDRQRCNDAGAHRG